MRRGFGEIAKGGRWRSDGRRDSLSNPLFFEYVTSLLRLLFFNKNSFRCHETSLTAINELLTFGLNNSFS